jgi:hypothetical protein
MSSEHEAAYQKKIDDCYATMNEVEMAIKNGYTKNDMEKLGYTDVENNTLDTNRNLLGTRHYMLRNQIKRLQESKRGSKSWYNL